MLFDELGDAVFTNFAAVAAKVEERMTNWGREDEEEEDDEDSSTKKGLPEKKKKKLLDAKTWQVL